MSKDKQKGKVIRLAIFIARLLLASAATFLLASALHTQSVLSDLSAVGAEIPLMLRIETVFTDWLGLLPTYGLIILVGMLIAMSVARLLVELIAKRSTHFTALSSGSAQTVLICLYAVAGGLAIFCILSAMHPILNVTIIAGARGWEGILSQSIAGTVGGAIFALTYKVTTFKKGTD